MMDADSRGRLTVRSQAEWQAHEAPEDGSAPSGSVEDLRHAAELFAAAPKRLGGVWLRGFWGGGRERWLSSVQVALGSARPWVRLPVATSEDRLLGGLDLARTLHSGRVAVEDGLLKRSHRGILVVSMAERLEEARVAQLCAAMDTGEVRLERDGISRRDDTNFALIALDEGVGDEKIDEALADRLGLWIDLRHFTADRLEALDCGQSLGRAQSVQGISQPAIDQVSIDNEAYLALVSTAWALGITSLRAPCFAVELARVSAATRGAPEVDDEDLALAVRLVFAPRALKMPEFADAATEDDSQTSTADSPEGEAASGDNPDRPDPTSAGLSRGERLVEVARAALPDKILARLDAQPTRRRGARRGSGVRRSCRLRGRRIGSVPGDPTRGAKLHVLDTLRAAAPWQRLRGGKHSPKFELRSEDFRISRYRDREETLNIFLVDASGSAAAARLAEAKGAIEFVLLECYSRRDEVALIAFRRKEAVVVLPPTRSLVRAKRAIAALPGGGGTPLAAGIDAAQAMAEAARKRGQSSRVILMTDGRANVARDGGEGRNMARADAERSLRALGSGVASILWVDTGKRPYPAAKHFADIAGACYLHLPYSDPGQIASRVGELPRGF